MAIKQKKIESIRYNENTNQVEIIIKNVNIGTSFSRSIDPLIRKEFKKWISKSDNQKEVKWTYLSRWSIDHSKEYLLERQDDQYYKYIGYIDILY